MGRLASDVGFGQILTKKESPFCAFAMENPGESILERDKSEVYYGEGWWRIL